MSKFSSLLKGHVSQQLGNPFSSRTDDIDSGSTLGDVISVVYDNQKTSIGEIAITVRAQDGSKVNTTAIPFDPHNFMVPVPNERVHLIKDPMDDQFYYTGIVPPAVYRGNMNYFLNARSRTYKEGTNQLHTGNLFQVSPNQIRSLDLYEGDYSIQSRYGSSIRLTSTNRQIKTPWQKSKTELATPVMILRNGFLPLEDLAYDPASIYLTSNQHVDIPFKAAFPSDLESTKVEYDKAQVILYSDRICLGSRTDDVILNSKKTIQLLTQNWAHNVDEVLDTLEELIIEVKKLTGIVKDMNLTNSSETFIIPGLGKSALSTKLPDHITAFQNALSIETKMGSIEQKLGLLKQK